MAGAQEGYSRAGELRGELHRYTDPDEDPDACPECGRSDDDEEEDKEEVEDDDND